MQIEVKLGTMLSQLCPTSGYFFRKPLKFYNYKSFKFGLIFVIYSLYGVQKKILQYGTIM